MRLHLIGRWLTAPFLALEQCLPRSGRFLDVGCGHGLFDLYLTYRSSRRRVVGIDSDTRKIVVAQGLPVNGGRLRFVRGELGFLDKRVFDGILLVDMLYLLSPAEKEQLLVEVYERLSSKGRVYLVTIPASFSLRYWLSYFQECIAVYWLRLSASTSGNLFFYSLERYRSLFSRVGFVVDREVKLPSFSYHPYHLFILKRRVFKLPRLPGGNVT